MFRLYFCLGKNNKTTKMSLKIKKTDFKNPDFICLIKELDASLKTTDGDEHDFYNQFNHIGKLKQVVVAYKNKLAIGCGAIKFFEDQTMEIKRMYVAPTHRGFDVALQIMIALEEWTKELGFKKCVLETGTRQVAAVKFYEKCEYKIISNYGQYKNVENSVCFEKLL
jgi:putative acetyltransferase